MIIANFSGRMGSGGISELIASVNSEKTCLKKLMMMKMIINIMNKSQETTFSCGRQKLTSAMKLRVEK